MKIVKSIEDSGLLIKSFSETMKTAAKKTKTWVALYVNGDNATYFDTFGVEYISKESKKIMKIKIIKGNIYRIWANSSIIYRCFCIGFIDIVLGSFFHYSFYFPFVNLLMNCLSWWKKFVRLYPFIFSKRIQKKSDKIILITLKHFSIILKHTKTKHFCYY